MLVVKQLPLKQILKCTARKPEVKDFHQGEFLCHLAGLHGTEKSKISVTTLKAICSHYLKIPLYRSWTNSGRCNGERSNGCGTDAVVNKGDVMYNTSKHFNIYNKKTNKQTWKNKKPNPDKHGNHKGEFKTPGDEASLRKLDSGLYAKY